MSADSRRNFNTLEPQTMNRLTPQSKRRSLLSNRSRLRLRSGQALIESLIVILITCMILFGMLQVATVHVGSEIMHHASARAARARAVGFNDWMILKALRVASIPNSGKMIEPDFQPFNNASPFRNNPHPGDAIDIALSANPAASERAEFERLRIPLYLASANHGRASAELNYEEWERGSFTHSESGSAFGGGVLRMTVEQDFPLRMPFIGLLIPFARIDENGDRRMTLKGEAIAGEHSSLYLQR